MARLRIVITANARQDIRRLDKQTARRLKKKFVAWSKSDQPLDLAVRLTKPADAQYRLRVGNYRVLFDVDNKRGLIIVLKVQHRSQVYR